MIQTQTPPTADSTPRATIIRLLADLAAKQTLANQIHAEQQQQVEAIKAATAKSLGPTMEAIQALEEQIEALATEHRAELYGPKGKTLTLMGHQLSFRSTTRVVCEDEEQVTAFLEDLRDNGPDEAAKLAAASCLRQETSLNKTFVKDHWERFYQWFTYAGFDLRTSDSFKLKLKLTPDKEVR